MKKHDLDEIEGIIREQSGLAPWFKERLISVIDELRLERKCRSAYQEALTENYKGLREENEHLRRALNNIVTEEEEEEEE
jgi:hypothetical protein